LSAEARSQNVANAFQVSPILARYRRHPIWLLDDIYTTGATARSAAQTLQQQGFIVQGVIAVAKTQTVEHGTK
jgi:predicted amidophosphoribosyltransferase